MLRAHTNHKNVKKTTLSKFVTKFLNIGIFFNNYVYDFDNLSQRFKI